MNLASSHWSRLPMDVNHRQRRPGIGAAWLCLVAVGLISATSAPAQTLVKSKAVKSSVIVPTYDLHNLPEEDIEKAKEKLPEPTVAPDSPDDLASIDTI